MKQIGSAFSENVAKKSDVAKPATQDEPQKPELRRSAQLEKQATACLGYPVAAAAGIVALSKALDLPVG